MRTFNIWTNPDTKENEDLDLVNIKRYTLAELNQVAAQERHAVRDEALRRHALAVKRLQKDKAEVEQLEELLKRVI